MGQLESVCEGAASGLTKMAFKSGVSSQVRIAFKRLGPDHVACRYRWFQDLGEKRNWQRNEAFQREGGAWPEVLLEGESLIMGLLRAIMALLEIARDDEIRSPFFGKMRVSFGELLGRRGATQSCHENKAPKFQVNCGGGAFKFFKIAKDFLNYQRYGLWPAGKV